MKIEWVNEGHAVADAHAELAILTAWLQGVQHLKVSTTCMLTAARALHKEGKIKIECLMFEDRKYRINEEGRMTTWPPGLDDFLDKFLQRLLSWNR
jgi:hypothetical protein